MRHRYHIVKKEEKELSKEFYYDLSKKEMVWIIIIAIISSFISFLPIIPDPIIIFSTLLIFFMILLVNFYAKKLGANIHSLKIEHKIWELTTVGFTKRSHFKKPIPIGLILPFFISIFSLGNIKPYTFFQYEYENKSSRRMLKAVGWKKALRKEYVNEYDFAMTAAYGFFSLIILTLIGYFIYFFDIKFGYDLAKFSIYYGLWNLVPVSNLDGAKVFFGSFIMWSFLIILFLISLALLFIV